jgi:uracil phosphoribosyltransferase
VLQLVSHPIADDCLAQLRDVNTPPALFRALTDRITVVLGAAAFATLPRRSVQVTTPLGPADGHRIDADVAIVPVMRAGLAMLTGLLQLVPLARVGFIGLRRDEQTAVASCYFDRLPEGLQGSHVILADPMLATGGSATSALQLLQTVGAHTITLLCIVAAPEGVAAVEGAFPDVRIITPVVDRELNAHKFIVPGLGDFGDRLYGTS